MSKSGIGNVPRPKMIGNDLLVDVRRIELAAFHLFADTADGVHDFNAAAIAQRHHQREAVVFGKCRDGFLEMFLHVFRQAVNLADDFEADVVLVQHLRRFGSEIVDEIFHQRVHFVLGPVRVLGGKGVEREILDAEFAGGADDDARGFRASAECVPRCAASRAASPSGRCRP